MSSQTEGAFTEAGIQRHCAAFQLAEALDGTTGCGGPGASCMSTSTIPPLIDSPFLSRMDAAACMHLRRNFGSPPGRFTTRRQRYVKVLRSGPSPRAANPLVAPGPLASSGKNSASLIAIGVHPQRPGRYWSRKTRREKLACPAGTRT